MKALKKKELVSLLKSCNDDFTNYSLQDADHYVGLQYDALKKALLLMKAKGEKDRDRKLIKV